MLEQMADEAPEPKLKPIKRALVAVGKRLGTGQWGITIRLGHTEAFLGLTVTRIIIQDVVRKPIPKLGKARFINFPGM